MTQRTRGAAGRRVVSLVPSITETLLSWGVMPVGVTRYCDLSGLAGTPGGVPDRQRLEDPAGAGLVAASQAARRACLVGGTKNPDVPAIVDLGPDVVFMDSEENRLEDAEALRAAGLNVVATAVRSLRDVPSALKLLAAQAGVPGYAHSEPLPGMSTPDELLGPRVFVPIWRRPWMTISADTYGGSVLQAVGLKNVFADASQRYPNVEIAEAARLGTEVVLAPSEPYPFKERHRGELEGLAPVEFVDGRDLFWWGSRSSGAVVRLGALARRLRDG